ncbi:MAG: hypothetical protein LBT00_08580 [Spirochaetaceae bacterium]|jgi:hypothetical protein|nr:hypothetical protein [Spirochaetaceae bacterium]
MEIVNARFMAVPVRLFVVLIAVAAVLTAGNIGQYLYFTGRIRADALGYSERKRELESRHAILEGELDRERSRKRKAVELIGGIEAAIERTGTGVQAAIGLVRTIREELKEMEACLNN